MDAIDFEAAVAIGTLTIVAGGILFLPYYLWATRTRSNGPTAEANSFDERSPGDSVGTLLREVGNDSRRAGAPQLVDYAGIQQVAGGRPRRWFHSESEDLIVWYADDGSIFGFQLCYDKQKSQRALTWLPTSGFSHDRVDDGEGSPLTYKRAPELVADGAFDAPAMSIYFPRISGSLPRDVFAFVSGKLQEYAR